MATTELGISKGLPGIVSVLFFILLRMGSAEDKNSCEELVWFSFYSLNPKQIKPEKRHEKEGVGLRWHL